MGHFRLAIVVQIVLCAVLIYFVTNPAEGININYGRSEAHAIGRNGHRSSSVADTHGYHVGIGHANGDYQTLHQETGSRSRGYQTGPGAPQTWASGGSLVGPGGSGGGVNAGFRGGSGHTSAQHVSQQIAIPIGNTGSTLYHNIPSKKKKTRSYEEWEY